MRNFLRCSLLALRAVFTTFHLATLIHHLYRRQLSVGTLLAFSISRLKKNLCFCFILDKSVLDKLCQNTLCKKIPRKSSPAYTRFISGVSIYLLNKYLQSLIVVFAGLHE